MLGIILFNETQVTVDHRETVDKIMALRFGTLYLTPLFSLRICCCRRKEGNVLFNDALNTFYLRLYGVRHMVKDHYDSEKGNPLPSHRLL